MELAEERVRQLQLFPAEVDFKWMQYDDKCDAAYATIAAMDGYGMNCAHVLFGPFCDYALGKRIPKCHFRRFLNYIYVCLFAHLHISSAPVSRIAKYFRNDGTPLLTGGGFSFDFQQRKETCADEYHMLVRTGLLSYQAISDLMVDVMQE